MSRQSLLCASLILCAHLTMSSSSELFLVEATKMLANNEILPDNKIEASGEATILIDSKIETTQSYENVIDPRVESESSVDENEKLSKAHSNLLQGSVSKSYQSKEPLFVSESSEISKEKQSKPSSNLSNGSEEYTTTTDSNPIEKELWKDTTTEVVESNITNTNSDFDNASTASVDFDEILRPLDYVFKLTLNTEPSNDDKKYITSDATTEGDIEFTQHANKNLSHVNLKLKEAADIQMRGIVEIPTKSVETLGLKESDDLISTTEDSMKIENGFATIEFSKDQTEIDIRRIQDSTTDVGIMEDRYIEYGATSDFSDSEDLTNQTTESAARNITSGGPSDSLYPEDLTILSTESAPWNTTSDPDKAYTMNFTILDPSKADTTSQRSIELTTESISLTNTSEEITIRSSTIIGTSENLNSVEGTAVVNKIECETPSANGKKYRDSETSRNSIKDADVETGTELENSLPTSNNNVVSETKANKPKVNPTQTTTFKTKELNSHGTAAPTKIPSLTLSKLKQIHAPSAWYTNIIPLYPIYLLNPLNYFYNSTNQTVSGPSALPTAWNYTTLFNPPAFNFTNLLSQILLPAISTTARHGFVQQTQTNLTNFQFFPFLRLFNKTKFATNTQTATTVNASDVLTAVLQLKNAKFQQLQTVQTNANANNALFVSRQWYTPFVSDNLERSEEVPFLTPIVRYSNNQDQPDVEY